MAMDPAEGGFSEIREAIVRLVQALARHEQRRDDWPERLDDQLKQDAIAGNRSYPQGVTAEVLQTLFEQLFGRLQETVPALDREILIQLHGDPLSPATRDARRNLDAVSAAILIGCAFTTGDVEVLSLKVHLSVYLAAAMLLLLGYHAVSFALYRRSDSVKFQRARQGASAYIRRLRSTVEAIASRGTQLARLDARDAADRVGAWVARQRVTIDQYDSDVGTARRRELWEFLVPVILGSLACLGLFLRIGTDLLPFVEQPSDCTSAREALKQAKAKQVTACHR
ncbi:MAG TPA: hypothetical protein VHM70_26415 [Polyangiaceae bacterium]|jgi:hypothetical protein|nr:hypothetical protein [Polyangiaceae bacterium]